MTPLVRRSFLKEFSIGVSCAFVLFGIAPLAWGQHPAGHPGGTVVHVPPPPISHVPIYHAPIAPPMTHAPALYSPVAAPRIATVPSVGTLGIVVRPPRRPIRPFPVILIFSPPFAFGTPFWGFNSCGLTVCDLWWPWTYESTNIYSPGPISYVPQVSDSPPEAYGAERPDLPELDLKDGSILNVTDYWVVDNQLHFMIVEEEGAKPTEEVIPFDALDLQKTVDVNTRRGFRFMVRNEPFEQYIRDHPEGPPPAITP